MYAANQGMDIPVEKTESQDGRFSTTKISLPREMKDWGEEVSGALSSKALETVEQFFGITPHISSWVIRENGQIPSTFEFILPAAEGVEYCLRIWQHGVTDDGDAEIDIFVRSLQGAHAFSFSSGIQRVVWVGIGHGQLLIATDFELLHRITRNRDSRYARNRTVIRYSKVKGFGIETSSLSDPLNQFRHYVPAHLRSHA